MLSSTDCCDPAQLEAAKAYALTLLRDLGVADTFPFSPAYTSTKARDTDAQIANVLIHLCLAKREAEAYKGEAEERTRRTIEDVKRAEQQVVRRWQLRLIGRNEASNAARRKRPPELAAASPVLLYHFTMCVAYCRRKLPTLSRPARCCGKSWQRRSSCAEQGKSPFL